ncbi:hypothetical protein ABZ499_27475 [Streptomyces sp. NPDC019990]|uniref:hypothetical protein n=1 Tax=Streptomyces sp. NPDC019990 TaxID=3154693 RepID=UPI0033D4FD51
MAITLLNTTTGPVDVRTVIGLPIVPVEGYGECGECGAELEALKSDSGEVRTTFCEYCD